MVAAPDDKYSVSFPSQRCSLFVRLPFYSILNLHVNRIQTKCFRLFALAMCTRSDAIPHEDWTARLKSRAETTVSSRIIDRLRNYNRASTRDKKFVISFFCLHSIIYVTGNEHTIGLCG